MPFFICKNQHIDQITTNMANDQFDNTEFDEHKKMFFGRLEEVFFTVPKYIVLSFMCQRRIPKKNDIIRMALKRKYTFCDKFCTEELCEAFDNLAENGYIVKIDSYHLETIHRLLDMCKIEHQGLLPSLDDWDVTPKGYSVYSYIMSIFDMSHLESEESTLMKKNAKPVCGCALTKEYLIEAINNSYEMKRIIKYHPKAFDLNEIKPCMPWCRRWWKIIPKGFSCDINADE